MWRSRLVTGSVAFGVALLFALACETGYPVTSFRCWPGGPDPQCPGTFDIDIPTYLCCSDDATALDLGNLGIAALPDYGRDDSEGTGTPLFSAANNHLSYSGMCVKSDSVPHSARLSSPGVVGCPVPCNPSWDVTSIEIVCGEDMICCQTVEIEEADCVLDPELGDAGCWRPARGEDIEGLGGLEATNWSSDEHATHQDPNGIGCQEFVAGLSNAQLDTAQVSASEVLQACYQRLGVANQRGFCLGGKGVNFCPLAQPSYRDACEQLNDAEGLTGCG